MFWSGGCVYGFLRLLSSLSVDFDFPDGYLCRLVGFDFPAGMIAID